MANNRQPKILFFDIESSPVEGLTWGLRETDVVHVKRNSHLLSFAAKWAHEKKTSCYALPDFPNTFKKDPRDDSKLARKLHEVLSSADIIVAHNAQFDIRKSWGRFLYHRIPAPPPARVFCTLKTARKHFFLDSNRLDALAKLLLGEGKLKHSGMSMWVRCLEGDPAAFREMKKYNIVDVQILERVFNRLVPYSTSFPDLNMWTKAGACPSCQSTHVTQRGFNVAKTRRTQRLQCQSCGHWHSGAVVK